MDSLADPSDRELLTSFVNERCERSFTLLVHRYAGLVHGVAARTLDHAGLADDVGQLTFLLLSQKASRLLRHDHLAGWLHRTAYQQALNLNRGQRRAQQKHLRHQESITMSHLDQEPWQEIAPMLDRELQKLSASDRSILVKRFFAEYSLKELAAHIGISQAAAEKRLQRSLARLRDRLNRRGPDLTISALVAALTLGGAQSSSGAFANQWAALAIQSPPQSISLFTKLVTLIVMKKALSAVIVILVLALFWSQSPWAPFSPEFGSGNGVGENRISNREAVLKSGRRMAGTKSATISGRVVDRETGAPVSGAKVDFWGSKFENPISIDDVPGQTSSLEEFSDREGNYTIQIPDASRGLHFRLDVTSEGYCRSFMKIATTWKGHEADSMGEEGSEALHGLVRASDEQVVDFKIVRESPFSGTVLDERGVPIPGVEVQLWYLYGHYRSGGTVGITKSDEKGEFEVKGSPASVLYGDLEMKFEHPNFASETRKGLQTMTASRWS